MSIRPRSGVQIPPLTAQVARASNPGGTTAIWVRDRLVAGPGLRRLVSAGWPAGPVASSAGHGLCAPGPARAVLPRTSRQNRPVGAMVPCSDGPAVRAAGTRHRVLAISRITCPRSPALRRRTAWRRTLGRPPSRAPRAQAGNAAAVADSFAPMVAAGGGHSRSRLPSPTSPHP